MAVLDRKTRAGLVARRDALVHDLRTWKLLLVKDRDAAHKAVAALTAAIDRFDARRAYRTDDAVTYAVTAA